MFPDPMIQTYSIPWIDTSESTVHDEININDETGKSIPQIIEVDAARNTYMINSIVETRIMGLWAAHKFLKSKTHSFEAM
ncbi:hypothetical protein U9M48_025780 [Paspalum notatum var. saurae]|uniref:Uncharacterized protein n=1 Tax=Paspalum notatum var. saurae TaxID=547442 RepID=A0AAQ3TPI2_PASNO